MTSSTTLLEAVNKVLLNVGERSTNNLTLNPAARKATSYIQEAYEDIQQYQDWSWQRYVFTATSWSGELATFTNLKRINVVTWNNDVTRAVVPIVDVEQFYATSQLTSFTDNANYPSFYAPYSHDTIAINPYPTDVTGRARLNVIGYKLFDTPTTTTSTFACPEEYVSTIIKKATATMLQRHLGELNEARELLNDFQTKLRYLLAKDAPIKNYTMYRRLI
jgi:hypothetical protein